MSTDSTIITYMGKAIDKYVINGKTAYFESDIKELLKTLKQTTSRLDKISQGFNYPREDMISMVEKAKNVISKYERVGGE